MSCYGCSDTGRLRGGFCPCTYCSECLDSTGEPLETLDIKGNGGAYRPCSACLAERAVYRAREREIELLIDEDRDCSGGAP